MKKNLRYICFKISLISIIKILIFYDYKTFNEKLSKFHINLFLKKTILLVNLFFNYLRLSKFRNTYFLTFKKRDLEKARNELLEYNHHNLNYFPIIHVEIFIHSIYNNKELSETIKSIDKLIRTYNFPCTTLIHQNYV